MKSEKYDYQKDWMEYRKRRNWYRLSIFPGIIFIPLGLLYFRLIGLDPTNTALQFLLFGSWGTALLISWSRFISWKCPHCREQFVFASLTVGKNPELASKCQNCDWPKYYGSNFYKSKQTFFPRYYPRNKN